MNRKFKRANKKIICTILSIVMLISSGIIAANAVVDYLVFVRGDLDRDGHFNIGDLTYLQRCLAESTKPDYSVAEADFNGDKRVNISDVTYGQEILAGLKEFLPVESSTQTTTSPTDENHYYDYQLAAEFRELINDYREENGLNRLEYRPDIQEISDIRAQDLTTLFTHVRKDGKSCFNLYLEKNIDFTYAAETFSLSTFSTKNLLRYWKNNEYYNEKMLNPRVTGICTTCYVIVSPHSVEKIWVADYVG